MLGTFDPNVILLSMVASGVGLAFFTYGKRSQRIPHLIAGLLLMIYPYFTPTTTQTVVVGGCICGGLWFAVAWGY